MQTIGSSSLSLGTSIQVISMAAGSPGEQGVKRSSTITWLLLRDGPRTCRSDKEDNEDTSRDKLPVQAVFSPRTFLKCVADCTFLTGCMSASRTMMLMSAPE